MADTPPKVTKAASRAKPKAAPAAAKTAAPKKTATRSKAAKPAAATAAAAAAPRKPIREQIDATTENLRAEATRKANEIGEEVGRLYGQASEKAMDVARTGKSKAAEGLESLAKIIDDSAVTVDDKLGAQYGDFARSAAQTVTNLAGQLEEKDIDELVAATRDFVRKSPAVAIGSAAVVGFMLARLLRGSGTKD
jgi:ElaB/YqjD/DUF883 family membrane-anchored ribosome-binding protein